jgi:hypothetical protein
MDGLVVAKENVEYRTLNREVMRMKRFMLPRVAHCGSGHASVPGTTENCFPR